MAWVRIDDQAPRHCKMLKAGPAACWLWVCGLAHCQSQLTDGFIPDEVLPMIGVVGVPRVQKLAQVLVDVGLFERVEGGYRIHDYFAFNATKDEAIERRRAISDRRSEAGRLGGLRTQQRRQANQANVKQTREVIAAEAKQQPSSPIPSHPIPSVTEEPDALRAPVLIKQKPDYGRTDPWAWACPHSPPCSGRVTCDVKAKLDAVRAS